MCIIRVAKKTRLVFYIIIIRDFILTASTYSKLVLEKRFSYQQTIFKEKKHVFRNINWILT